MTQEEHQQLSKSQYYNKDLASTTISQRTWTAVSICNLWIGLAISIPALALVSSLVALGISPLLAIVNVVLGNIIVLIPIQLNSHVGTKYDFPFPIFARMTFGTKGAQTPTISRSIIACGWTSIQTRVGGFAFVYMAGLTGNIAYWSTMALNIPDFSRYTKSQKSQFLGQLTGMPISMLFVRLE